MAKTVGAMNTCECGNPANGNGTTCQRCEALHELGLKAGATDAEVKTAYRLYVKAWHPDRFPGDEKSKSAAQEKLKCINSAYEFLNSASSKRGQPYRPKAAAQPTQPQEPTQQKQNSAKQHPPAGGRGQASPPKGNTGGQAPPWPTNPTPPHPTPSAARRWGIFFGLFAGRLRRVPRWTLLASSALLAFIIVFAGMTLSFTPATISKRAKILDSEHHYNLGGILRNLACTRGDGWSCAILGHMYLQGIGVPKDDSRALALYSRASVLLSEACDAGKAKECGYLGVMYGKGIGVAEDDSLAERLLSMACDRGDSHGCAFLGRRYMTGDGEYKDYSRAVVLLAKACDAGDADGCANLGVMYGRGLGVAKDDSHAVALYSEGCDAGNALGCTNLGNHYRFGLGIAKDSVKARQLLAKGCGMGNQLGCNQMKEMQ